MFYETYNWNGELARSPCPLAEVHMGAGTDRDLAKLLNPWTYLRGDPTICGRLGEVFRHGVCTKILEQLALTRDHRPDWASPRLRGLESLHFMAVAIKIIICPEGCSKSLLCKAKRLLIGCRVT